MPISRDARAALAVALVALLACVFGFSNSFAHDDAALIQQDARLHDLTQLGAILTEPYWPPPYAPDQYRPVTSIALTFQYVIGGGHPAPFRLVAYLMYAAVAVAVLRFALLLLPFGAAVAGALLFAAHPVHVEATALAVAQGELIVALCIVSATVLYLRHRRAGQTRDRRWWGTLAGLYAVAMFSKEQGFLLPGFLLLAEFLLVRGEGIRERIRKAGPLYGVLAAVAVVGILARIAVLGDLAVQPNVAEALANKTLAGRAVTMFRIFPEWMRLFAWPAHLRIDYSPREFLGSTTVGGPEVFGFIVFLAVLIVAVLLRRRVPVATFGLAWMALALLPVSNVFIATGVLIAERTLFLPSIGFILAIAALGAALVTAASRRGVRPVRVAAGVVAALTLAGVLRSAARQRDWRDNDALTLSAIRDSPRSWRAQANHAELLFERGQVAEGRAAFERAIALAPSPWWTRNAYARRLRAIGDDSTALLQLRTSLSEFPLQVEAVPELVAALIAIGRYDEARSVAHRVILLSDAPQIMVRLRQIADSAHAAGAEPGTVRVTVPSASGAPGSRPGRIAY